jgi:hypothetical protein
MKAFALSVAFLATAFSFQSVAIPLEDIAPHFSTNTEIIWQAPTNDLPKSLWIYRKILPHIFPATIISNAIILASFQSKGFPKPSTNNTCITVNDCHCSCATFCNFSIFPQWATLSYSMPNPEPISANIPDDKILVKDAWDCALQLGVDPAQAALKDITFHFNSDENGNLFTNQISGRGVYLSRQFDGVKFIGDGNDNFIAQGFYIEFGSYGEVRAFSLVWPDVKRDKQSEIASPQQIIHCIRARRVVVFPNRNEATYFERVKSLAKAKTLTITKITPYYGDGVFGEVPTDGEPKKFAPFAELDAVADFGTSNATVRLCSPILSSEVNRLLEK